MHGVSTWSYAYAAILAQMHTAHSNTESTETKAAQRNLPRTSSLMLSWPFFIAIGDISAAVDGVQERLAVAQMEMELKNAGQEEVEGRAIKVGSRQESIWL